MCSSTKTQEKLYQQTPAVDFSFDLDGDTDHSSEGSGRASEDWTLASGSPKEDTARPYPCPFPACQQRFKRSYTLKDHINVHTGEKPFVCPVRSCRRSFATSGNLARHKRIHPWLGKMVQCLFDGCGCEFSSDVKLERHLRTHFGEMPGHRCTIAGCSKSFSTPGNLRRHVRINHSTKSRLNPVVAKAANACSERVPIKFDVLVPALDRVDPMGSMEDSALSDSLMMVLDQDIFEVLSCLFDDEETVEYTSV